MLQVDRSSNASELPDAVDLTQVVRDQMARLRGESNDDAPGLVPSAISAAGAVAEDDRAASTARSRPTREKLRANRRNARKSTGPRTPEGKRIAAQNARTHGIFCSELLLEGEDEQEFRLFRHSLLDDLNPEGAVQQLIADRAVIVAWKLRRVTDAEADEHQTMSDQLLRSHLVATGYLTPTEATDPACVAEAIDLARDDGERPEVRLPAGAALARSMREGGVFERLGRYEQRLSSMFLRYCRELRSIKESIQRHSASTGTTRGSDAESNVTPDTSHAVAERLADHRSAASDSAAPAHPGLGSGTGVGEYTICQNEANSARIDAKPAATEHCSDAPRQLSRAGAAPIPAPAAVSPQLPPPGCHRGDDAPGTPRDRR